MPLRFQPVFVPLAIFALAGCSGAPSDANIEAALSHAYSSNSSEARSLLSDMGMDSLLPEFEGADKLACAPAANGRGYLCDVELTTTQFGQSRTRVVEMRFVRGDKGWRLAEATP
ncbi:MAG: hypothetical protein RH979_03105 [Algiphilus sp.]|uniref:hypothetical protein n=1 Tax=Algiphilus sp. TaxID=1872431 RepID=UPI0032EF22A6